MKDKNKPELSKLYLMAVLLLTLVLPAVSVLAEWLLTGIQPISLALIGKWFIFWAVGIRLLMAGLRQVINPSFTAKEIFHIEDKSSFTIIRELGFANICFGLVGVISLFIPGWRVVSAFASGLYYGIAGVNHLIKKPAGLNELVALVSDIFIFLSLVIYLWQSF